MTDVEAIAAALGKVPSGIFILTARNGDQETGMLASWVQQCSFDPPQISVAVQRGRFVHTLLPDGAAFALNVVAADSSKFLKHFGKGFEAGEPAFDGWTIDRTPAGAAALREALAHLDCRVVGRCDAGDHELVIGRVVGGRLHGDGKPMVHIRKNGLKY